MPGFEAVRQPNQRASQGGGSGLCSGYRAFVVDKRVLVPYPQRLWETPRAGRRDDRCSAAPLRAPSAGDAPTNTNGRRTGLRLEPPGNRCVFYFSATRLFGPWGGSGVWLEPAAGSVRGDVRSAIWVGCPSGQREQTVNLPAYAYEGSNPSPTIESTRLVRGRRGRRASRESESAQA